MLDVDASMLNYENHPKFNEAFRIKIWNQPQGTIEVSFNGGKSYEAVGRVIFPAERVNAESYAASRWAEDGRVAATAVNAIHIKTTAGTTEGKGLVFSILPREFSRAPKGYRSYFSRASSVYTDIAAGEGIFGGGYSPFVGNTVLISQPAKPALPMPRDYIPHEGDKIYILVDRPADYPREMAFENKLGGKVTLTYYNGEAKLIGQVLRPLAGVGRFEGTKYASAGRIRANHSGVIDVSTARPGKIGGFQIVPAGHGANMGLTGGQSQWMIIGPPAADDPPLEGKAPFFKYFLKPAYHSSAIESEAWEQKLLNHFLVEVKLEGSDKWQSMPIHDFDEYYLTGEIPAWAHRALENVVQVRILFPIGAD